MLIKAGDSGRVAHIALNRVNAGKSLACSIKTGLASSRDNHRVAQRQEPAGKLETNSGGSARYQDRIVEIRIAALSAYAALMR